MVCLIFLLSPKFLFQAQITEKSSHFLLFIRIRPRNCLWVDCLVSIRYPSLTPNRRLFSICYGIRDWRAISILLAHLHPRRCRFYLPCAKLQCKVLAQQFEVSVPTMSNHITHIREKIIPPFTLRHVLSKLRAWGKYSILNI